MNFADERWIKLYTRDEPDFLSLSWQARGLLFHLLRKVDRAGVLRCGRIGKKGIAVTMSAPWAEIAPYLEELLEDGCVEFDAETGTFTIPNFHEAQEAKASGRARQRASRELAKAMVANNLPPKGDSRTIERLSGDAASRLTDATSHETYTGRRAQTLADVGRRSEQNRSEQNRGEPPYPPVGDGENFSIQEPADEPPTGNAEPQGLAAPSRPQGEVDATHAASPPQTAVKSQPERKPDPTPNPRRGVQRNAWNEFRPMWVQDYARMVTEAIKAPWAFPRGQTQDLADALATHCLGEDSDPFKVAGWLERNLKPFIAMATEKGPNFWSEYGPRGFLKYLNSPHLKPPEMPASLRSPEPIAASRPATPEETAQAASAMRDLLANLTSMNPDPPREPTPIPEAWKAHQKTLVLPEKPPRRPS